MLAVLPLRQHRRFGEARMNASVDELFDQTAEADPDSARQLRLRFQEWLRTLGVPAAVVDDLTLAVYEALANAAEHAYHPGHPHPMMRLRAQLDHNQLLITITDYGCWRTPQEPGYRGRGLAMMRSLTTEVHLNPTAQGTTVHLRAAVHRGRDGHAPTESTVAH